MATPMKKSHRPSENLNPNLPISTPRRKPFSSPAIKPSKPSKSTPKTPISTPHKKTRSEKKRPQVSPSTDQVIGSRAQKDLPTLTAAIEAAERSGSSDQDGSSKVRKMKRRMLEEARSSIPDTGCGRVLHLVHAFERLLSLPKESQDKQGARRLVFPGLEIEGSSVGFSSLDDSERDSSRLSWGSSTSGGGRSSRRNSTDSSEKSWKKKLKVTNQQPFKLRTEQRGRLKERQFVKKVNEMLLEEEKQRIPIAQRLPLTTDDPESVAKPPVKESTEPIDLVLHSDVRAVERAEFDHQIAERLNFIEQIKLERKQQQELKQEEETRRLRRELIPRAQPMPYFDRPFIPKKSSRPQTVPKEPRFHNRQ